MRTFMNISIFLLTLVLLTAATAFAQPASQPAPYEPPAGVSAIRDIEYVKGGGLSQSLDLYFVNQSHATLRPLIVWIHGGGWMRGDKNPSVAINFVQRGYIVASIDYRVSSVAHFPAQIQDCQAAIRFLRGNAAKYGIDPHHIGVWGNSAGAHLCNLLGTAGGQNAFAPVGGFLDQSDRVQAVCAFCGPTDLHTVRAQADANAEVKSIVQFNTPTDPYSVLIGVPLGQDADRELAASPVHYIHKGADNLAFLIVHGTADAHVPFAQAQEFAEELRKADVDVTFQRLPGSDHPSKVYYRPPVTKLVEAFFDRYLKGADVKVTVIPDEAVALPTTKSALKLEK